MGTTTLKDQHVYFFVESLSYEYFKVNNCNPTIYNYELFVRYFACGTFKKLIKFNL